MQFLHQLVKYLYSPAWLNFYKSKYNILIDNNFIIYFTYKKKDS